MSLVLFTRDNCAKCDYVKEHVDLEAIGVEVHVLTKDDPAALGLLAFHECVQTAETQLPILVIDDKDGYRNMTGAIEIKKYLEGI